MKRRWAVLAGLLLLLLLWMFRSEVGGPRDPGLRSGATPAALPPVPSPTKAAPEAPAPGDVAREDTPPKGSAPGPPGPEGGDGVSGRIVRADRSPAADLPVTVSLDGKVLAEVRTGPDGGYMFPPMDVPAGDRTHFVFTYAVRDGKGRAARDTLRESVVFNPDEERTLRLEGSGMQTLVLRDAVTLLVRVTAAGAPVEGATAWAEEETPLHDSTEPVTSGRDGLARIEDLPHGRWTVFARAPGHGAGRSRAEVPSKDPVEVPLSPRVLEIEAVDAATGAPAEGIRFQVSERRSVGEDSKWEETFPPLDPPPTDSAGKTRLENIGDVELAILPIPKGREEPVRGWKRVEVDARAATVRVPVPALRTVTFPVEAGERGVPPDGGSYEIGEERILRHPVWWAQWPQRWEGTMRGGSLVVTGIDPGPFRALAGAPDGSLARLEVPADTDRGSPTRFLAPRRLVVRVKDEDGKLVRDLVAVLSPAGEAVAQPEWTDAEGKAVFATLYAGEVVVCALARNESGGAEVARVDLAAGDRTVEAVVGREFTVVARFKVGGKAHLPESYELCWLTPGPQLRGQPHEESVWEPEEDPAFGTIRLRVRPWSPGKPVTLQLTVPGRKPVTREIHPPAAGGEVAIDIDLE